MVKNKDMSEKERKMKAKLQSLDTKETIQESGLMPMLSSQANLGSKFPSPTFCVTLGRSPSISEVILKKIQ